MSITFLADSAIGEEQCAVFIITNDGVSEPEESFTVTGAGRNFVGGQNSTQVNILDIDGKKDGCGYSAAYSVA